MFIVQNKDGQFWAFSSCPVLDRETGWKGIKPTTRVSLSKKTCHYRGRWEGSLKTPESHDYEVSVHERFTMRGKQYECLPAEDTNCTACCFQRDEALCTHAPECLGVIRGDRQDVIYAELP